MRCVTAALLTHLFTFRAGAWLAGAPEPADFSWSLCYLVGAAFLAAGAWFPKLRLSPRAAFEVLGYSVLLAIVFWGANMALDILGNAVRVRRLAPELRAGLPIHFVLVPGVASVGVGALADALWRRIVAGRARGARQGEA